MKTSFKNLMVVCVAVISLMVISCKNTGKENPEPKENTVKVGQYTCPMHPEIVSDTAGTCSICGMELVEKTE